MAKTAQVSRVTRPADDPVRLLEQGAPLVQHLPSVPAALGWNDHLAALAADLPPGLIFGRVAPSRPWPGHRPHRRRAPCAPPPRTPSPSGDWVGVDPAPSASTPSCPAARRSPAAIPGRATSELVAGGQRRPRPGRAGPSTGP